MVSAIEASRLTYFGDDPESHNQCGRNSEVTENSVDPPLCVGYTWSKRQQPRCTLFYRYYRRQLCLEGVSFVGATLSGTNFENVQLHQTHFSSVEQLEQANLSHLRAAIFYWGLQRRTELVELVRCLMLGQDIDNWRQMHQEMALPISHIPHLVRWLGNYQPSECYAEDGTYHLDPATQLFVNWCHLILHPIR